MFCYAFLHSRCGQLCLLFGCEASYVHAADEPQSADIFCDAPLRSKMSPPPRLTQGPRHLCVRGLFFMPIEPELPQQRWFAA